MISATLITLNEENRIRKALMSLKKLADEIIVVDSGSSDKTAEIAESLGAKVFSHEFSNFAEQKNWAASKATGEWILSVDADEEISNDLAEEIKEAVKSRHFAGYLIPRRNFILKKEIKHSRWSPDVHIWLWKKDNGKWVGDVHEEVVVFGKVGLLKKSKIHHSHDNVGAFMEANNLYSGLEVQKLSQKKVKFSLINMFWEAFFEFFIRFFYKMGFLDRSEGFILAYLMGVYKMTVYVKLWELEQKK